MGLREKLNQEGNLLRSIIICVQNYQTHFLSKKKMSLRYSLVEQYRHSVYKKKHLLESINANNTYICQWNLKDGKGEGWGFDIWNSLVFVWLIRSCYLLPVHRLLIGYLALTYGQGYIHHFAAIFLLNSTNFHKLKWFSINSCPS